MGEASNKEVGTIEEGERMKYKWIYDPFEVSNLMMNLERLRDDGTFGNGCAQKELRQWRSNDERIEES